MTDVFISYSRKDADFARSLFDALKQTGRESWIDWESIPLSTEWWSEIKRGIDGANDFVFIISPDSLSSPVCALEVDHAVANHKRIIPVVFRQPDINTAFAALASAKIEGFLASMVGERDLLVTGRDNWKLLESINWVIFEKAEFETAFAKLVKAIETDPDRVRLHTRLLVRARQWEEQQRDESYLLVGTELHEAASWLKIYGDQPPQATETHRTYIAASLEKEAQDKAERERQITEFNTASERARRNRQRAVIAIILAIIVGVGAGVFAFAASLQVQDAVATIGRARGIAESLRLAQLAANYLVPDSYNPEVATLLATRALFNGYTQQADLVLEQARKGVFSRQIFLGHTAQVDDVAFSPDGTSLYSTSPDGTIRTWDVTSGKQTHALKSQSLYGFHNIAVASTGWIAAQSAGMIYIFDPSLSDNKPLSKTKITLYERGASKNKHENLEPLTFSPDGMLLTTPQTLYKIDSSAALTKVRDLSTTCCSTTTPDAKYIFKTNGGAFGNALVFSTSDNPMTQVEMTLPVNIQSSDVTLLTLSHDGHLGAAVFTNDVLVWNTATGKLLGTFRGHKGAINDLAFSPDGLWLASASEDTTVRIWDMTTLSQTPERILTGNIEGVLSVVFSPDSRLLVTGGLDRTARLYAVGKMADASTGDPSADLQWQTLVQPMPVFNNGVATNTAVLRQTADGRYRLEMFYSMESRNNILRWIDQTTGAKVDGFYDYGPDKRPIGGYVAFDTYQLSSNGQLVLTTHSRKVELWDAPTGELLAAVDKAGSFARFSPDYSTVISFSNLLNASQDVLQNPQPSSNAVFWSPSLTVRMDAPGEQTTGGAIAPNNQLVAIAYNNLIRLWDVTGQEAKVVGILREHTGTVQYLTFSADGRYLVSAGADKTLRLWDVSSQALIRTVPLEKIDQFDAVAFTNASKTTPEYVYLRSKDAVKRYNVVMSDLLSAMCSQLTRDFVASERVTFSLDSSPTCPK